MSLARPVLQVRHSHPQIQHLFLPNDRPSSSRLAGSLRALVDVRVLRRPCKTMSAGTGRRSRSRLVRKTCRRSARACRWLGRGLACETPFVAAYTGGTFELEEKKCGYGYKFSNISKLSEKLKYLLSDKKLAKKMGKHGRKIVRTEYDIKTVTERTEALYKQLLSG